MSSSIATPFFVSFSDAKETWQLGIPQAFKYEVKRLYALLFLGEYQGKSRVGWISADKCRCVALIDPYLLQDILKRDGITLKDLEVIEDFKSKYNKKAS